MGEVVPVSQEHPERKGPTPGQALFAAIVDEFAAKGATLPRSAVAVAAKHGAAALDDGVEPDVVLAGCLAALRAGKGRFAQDFIAEMAVVKADLHLSDREYRAQIEAHKARTNPDSEAPGRYGRGLTTKQIKEGR